MRTDILSKFGIDKNVRISEEYRNRAPGTNGVVQALTRIGEVMHACILFEESNVYRWIPLSALE